MHFQKHEQYAFLLMGELARSRERAPLSLSGVSNRHGVSLPFLKKIVRSLRAAGLVQSKEGVGGGYMLARDPQSISLWEIIFAMSATSENRNPAGSICPVNKYCLPQHIRSLISTSIRERLEKISLKEVAR